MKKQIKKIEKPLLERLYKKMHNWWWLGVQFDWELNPENGKVWVYKDCTGIEMKAKELYELEHWIKGENRI